MSRKNLIIICSVILIVIILIIVFVNKKKNNKQETTNTNYTYNYKTEFNEETGDEQYIVYNEQTGEKIVELNDPTMVQLYLDNPDYYVDYDINASPEAGIYNDELTIEE